MSNEFKNRPPSRGFQSILMIIISLLSFFVTLTTGILLYAQFSSLAKEKEIASTQEMMEQTRDSMENYLMRMRQISDTVYYDVVKGNSFSRGAQEIHTGMNLLYESNKENLVSIALYNNYGSLVAAEPVATQKEDPNITKQSWFQQAMDKVENIHFSTPHIQNLFENGKSQYDWVLSLSRGVELNDEGDSQLGVLLVDMNYYRISHLMAELNNASNSKYYYLCDSQGEIIYHPKQIQLAKEMVQENNLSAATFKEGTYDESFQGEERKVIINDISYTGWKLVGVIPPTTFVQERSRVGLLLALYILMMTMVLLGVNRWISLRISRPLQQLNDSVVEYESGKEPTIYIGGSSEIQHLGQSIQLSYEKNDALMKEVILEHNERRKSELDALQSQINPHFLYNTLESITWMIEGEQNDRAVFMVTQLAKLFRISLSSGRTVISVADELQHAKSYMNIQKQRYKDKVAVIFEIEPEVLQYSIVKLVLQPLLENSLNYAVSDLEDSGEIKITGKLVEDRVVLAVADNGPGMSEEQVNNVLVENAKIPKMGSGVGLVNVNKRLQLFFGKDYGLIIESQLDEGTCISIVIPAIPFNEENRQVLEQGFRYGGEEMIQGGEMTHEKK